MHLFIYCLWLLLHYKGRIGYLWQRLHSLWSLKYLLSGPLRKKTANFWAKWMFIAVCPWGSMVFCYDASLVKSSLTYLIWKLIPFPTPPAESASKAARAQGQNKSSRSSPPQEWTSWPGLQGWMPVHQRMPHSSFPVQGADHINLSASDQRQLESLLILLIASQHLWATDSIHCQLYTRDQLAKEHKWGEEIWKLKGSWVFTLIVILD